MRGVEFCSFADIVCIFHCLKWAPGKWMMSTHLPLGSYAYIQRFTFKVNIIFGSIFPGKVIKSQQNFLWKCVLENAMLKGLNNLSLSNSKPAVSLIRRMHYNLQITTFTIMVNKWANTKSCYGVAIVQYQSPRNFWWKCIHASARPNGRKHTSTLSKFMIRKMQYSV